MFAISVGFVVKVLLCLNFCGRLASDPEEDSKVLIIRQTSAVLFFEVYNLSW